MTRTINLKKFVTGLILPVGVFLLSVLSAPGMKSAYAGLEKPPLSPPSWMITFVWLTVFLLSGIACYIITDAKTKPGDLTVRLYLAYLAFSFLWTPVFFTLKWHGLSMVLLVALWAAAFLTMIRFRLTDRLAGNLMVAAVLWVSFLGYINMAVLFLN